MMRLFMRCMRDSLCAESLDNGAILEIFDRFGKEAVRAGSRADLRNKMRSSFIQENFLKRERKKIGKTLFPISTFCWACNKCI